MKLLLVDDDELLRERLARALAARGYEVTTASNVDEAGERISAAEHQGALFDHAVIDLKMPGGNGFDVLQQLAERSPTTRSVMLTGYGSIANAVDALHAGAVNYVTKPADADQILAAFRRAEDESPSPAPEQIQAPSLAEAEWNHIQQVLADSGGNITRAAAQLGIPRRTLQRKLKKLAP
ncbi:MAG: response regulator [Planctomycetota bacterium]